MASLQHVAPIFPTADMDAMRAHYEALGFAVHVHGGGYGTAARDGIRIHFKLVPDWGRPRSGVRPISASTTPTHCTPNGGRRRWGRPPTCSTPDSASGRRPTPMATATCCASGRPSRLDARRTRWEIYFVMMKAITSDLLLT